MYDLNNYTLKKGILRKRNQKLNNGLLSFSGNLFHGIYYGELKDTTIKDELKYIDYEKEYSDLKIKYPHVDEKTIEKMLRVRYPKAELDSKIRKHKRVREGYYKI